MALLPREAATLSEKITEGFDRELGRTVLGFSSVTIESDERVAVQVRDAEEACIARDAAHNSGFGNEIEIVPMYPRSDANL